MTIPTVKKNPQADDATILALTEAGKSSRDIATTLGTLHHSTVCRILKRLTPRKATEIYKSNRADILAEFQRKILLATSPADIKKMISSRGMTDYGILYDKERIERGLSDDNTRPLVVIQVRGQANITVDNPVDNSGLLISKVDNKYPEAIDV